jgi:hypothetical protein
MVYRHRLGEAMGGQGRLVALAGNHEPERLQAGLSGRQYRLMEHKGVDPSRVVELIIGLDLFHLAPPLLYLHGYPTVDFLRLLWKGYVAKGKSPDHDPIKIREFMGAAVLAGLEPHGSQIEAAGPGERRSLAKR